MNSKKQQKFLAMYQPVHAHFERFCRARSYGDFPFEDLVNESLLVAFTKMNDLKNNKSFLSFLIGISIKLLANWNKKSKAELLSDLDLEKAQGTVDCQFDKKFEVDLLHEALAQLNPEPREALILFEITGFSINEIAAIQKSSESAVKQRLVRGRRDLASIVDKEMMTIRK